MIWRIRCCSSGGERALCRHAQIAGEGGGEIADIGGDGGALGGRGMFIAQLGNLHLGEIGLGGARVIDRHQRAVECRHRNGAGGRQHAIAREPHQADDEAHRGEGAEDLGAD